MDHGTEGHLYEAVRRRVALLIGLVALACIGLEASPAQAEVPRSPGGRGYEMLSPADKNGGNAYIAVSTDDGEAVWAGTNAGAGDPRGVQLGSIALVRRGKDGWVWRAMDAHAAYPIGDRVSGTNFHAYSSDLSAWVGTSSIPLSADDLDEIEGDVFRVDGASGVAQLLSPPLAPGQEPIVVDYMGASRDLRHVIFTANEYPLVAGAPTTALYEWVDGTLRVASTLADGTYTGGNAMPRPSAYGTLGGSGNSPATTHGAAHQISDDGSRIFFKGGGATTPLYMREDGVRTYTVSESERSGTEGSALAGNFIFATHDGSVAYFWSTAQLTDAATPGGGIYRWDRDAPAGSRLEQLTPSTGGVNFNFGHGQASDDGSHVYFQSASNLVPGATGVRKIYVWSRDRGTRLVANGVDTSTNVERVSRSGRFALISSTVSLNGAPNNGKRALYLYDAVDESLTCISCRPDGSPSQGDASLEPPNLYVPTARTANRPRNITDDGAVFFNTSDRLVPGDINATDDVYEYRAGTVTLISSGRSTHPSFVLDNSDDGEDVFFATRDRLVGRDIDGAYDIYDARLGGGFPEPPARRPTCVEDQCQGPLPTVPAFLTPGSSLAVGPGNEIPDDDPSASPSIRVQTLTRGERAALVRRGWTNVRVRIAGGGTVRLSAVGRIRGVTRTVATGQRTIRQTRAVTARVRLRLTRSARRHLRRGGRVRISVVARVEGTASRPVTLTLSAARR